VCDLTFESLDIRPEEAPNEDPKKRERQLARDFGRFVTQIGPIVFNPVDDEHLMENLANIRCQINDHLRRDLLIGDKVQLKWCNDAVLDSLFNTPRRGEVWDAVRRRCEGSDLLHTRPTTIRLPTLAIFHSGRAVMAIATTVQIWEENGHAELELAMAVTCSTVTTIDKLGDGFSRKVAYHVTTQYFSPEEQKQANSLRQAHTGISR